MTSIIAKRLRHIAAVGVAVVAVQGCAASPRAAVATGHEEIEMNTQLVQTTLGKLAVHTTGEAGPHVVFWPAVFSDSSIYRAQVAALRGRYRLVLIDGPGFGGSDAPTRPFTMEACADAAAEVLRALGVQRAAWVGTSWGGIVGVHLALRYPQQVDRLVLMNTPFDVSADGPGLSDRMVVWGARWIGTTGLYANGVARSYFPAAWRSSHPEQLAAFVAAFKRPGSTGMAIAGRSVLLDRASVLPLLPQVNASTLVVAGADDAVYPAPMLKAAAERIEGARFVEIPGSGHISAMDSPERVTALLEREFVQHGQAAP